MIPKTCEAGHRANGEPAPEDDRLSGVINPINISRTNFAQFKLYYGTARTPLASVVPDARHSSLWRVVHAGTVSDMTNLARAKDAAMAICERGPPPRNRARFHWVLNRSESPPEGLTASQAKRGTIGSTGARP